MKYLSILLLLVFITSCKTRTYKGIVVEKHYSADGVGIGNGINTNGTATVITTYTPATYTLVINSNDTLHIFNAKKEDFFRFKVNDSITFNE